MVTNRARQEIIWIAPKKFQICSYDWQRWRFLSVFKHVWTKFANSFRMSKPSLMIDPTRSHEVLSISAIHLAENRRSSKISSWIWSIISGVVTILVRPGRGATQVKKSPGLNWAAQFLTVAYDGACSLNVSIRMTWISLRVLSCREKILNVSSRLDVVEIPRVALHVSFQPL